MKVKTSYLIKVMIIVSSFLCITILINLVKRDLWDMNAKSLKEQVLLLGQNTETLNLSNITPFQWEKVYSFAPYMPKDEIYTAIGYKWDNIRETVAEQMNQIVFLKDEKVVCYVYGYPSNNRYGISFDSADYKDGIAIFSIKDNLNFSVAKIDDVLYLEHLNNLK